MNTRPRSFFSNDTLHVLLETDNPKFESYQMVGTAEEIGQDLIETLSTMFHTVMHLSLDLPHEFIPINEQDIEILKQQIASQDYGMSVLAVNLGLTTYEALGINDQINPK